MAGTIVASVAGRVFDAGVRRGVSAEALSGVLRRSRRSLTDDARLPVARLYDAFALCLRQTQDAGFPLQAATEIALEDYAVLGFALMVSESADQAFGRLARFGHLITDSGAWRFNAETNQLDWVRAGARTLGHRAANECAVAELVNGLRRTFGSRLVLKGVRFRHAAPAHLGAHQRFFDAPIRFGQPTEGVDLPADMLAMPSQLKNPAMSRFFGSVLDRRGAKKQPVSAQLKEVLAQQLSSGTLTAREMAQRLGMSERSLRRSLTAEGTSYRAILEYVRRTTARELLEAGHRVTETAFLLGFSETSALSRALRRWRR